MYWQDSKRLLFWDVTRHRLMVLFFLHGEGPRSRRYGRTTALRLFVQPYDEDEDEDE
jgi:hypothetical protein